MGRLLLVSRLAVRDLRRRPAEAALLLVAIVGATATLTLGLVLHGVVSEPYRNTREATNGPDVIASSDGGRAAELAALEALADAPGVTRHSGPYPVTWAKLVAHGRTATAQAEGRDAAPAPVDQPNVIEGSWVGEKDAVVVEAAFADALGVDAGDSITLNGRSFRVAGVAVTAASSPYPEVSCLTFCIADTGLVWLARADARRLATRRLAHVLNLKLADPAAAPAFADRRNPKRTGVSCAPGSPCASKPLPPILMPWQDIREATASLVDNQRRALLTGGWLLVLLAIASVAVLVGSRMADQIRRVGLLKAVGGTPSLVAAVLLAEYVAVALLAAAVGLVIGWLAAPLVTDPSAGLLGSSGSPSLGVSTVGLVTAAALGVAVAATCVPAVRAARTSTVLALADSARPPRRTAWLISLSARLPISLLLGLRVAARRPRRVLLATASIAVTVSGIVAALAAHADLNVDQRAASVLDSSRVDRLNEVLLVITLTLVALAAVNAIFVAWASALDVRHSSALARALGATPQQVSAGLSTAQMLPALAGALLGIPGGIALISAVDPDATPLPPLWQLLAVVPSTVVIVAALTAIPARIVTRRPVTDTLRSELA